MRHVLNRFKSLADVARALDVNYVAVTKWAERDSIPGRYDRALVEYAKSKGIPLTRDELDDYRDGSRVEASSDKSVSGASI